MTARNLPVPSLEDVAMKPSSKTDKTTPEPSSLVDKASHGIASAVDEVKEEKHWRETFQSRPCVDGDASFEDYAPAYVYGVSWYRSNPQREFDESEADLETGWNTARGESALAWSKAKPAARDAWYRVDQP